MRARVGHACAALCLLCVGLQAEACRREGAPSIDEGRALYQANGCASCHGPNGHGDGPVGKTLTPMPRDFRDAAAFKNGRNVAAIASTLAAGLSRDGAKMPQFSHLTEAERDSIALFVLSAQDTSQERTIRP
jgi:high-affinity iron transporter